MEPKKLMGTLRYKGNSLDDRICLLLCNSFFLFLIRQLANANFWSNMSVWYIKYRLGLLLHEIFQTSHVVSSGMLEYTPRSGMLFIDSACLIQSRNPYSFHSYWKTLDTIQERPVYGFEAVCEDKKLPLKQAAESIGQLRIMIHEKNMRRMR